MISNKLKTTFRILPLLILPVVNVLVNGQNGSENSMPQYLFSDFSSCDVRMKNGQIQTPVMNYNIITEMMVFTRDDKYYDMINPDMVDTVFFQNNKFVPVGKAFYEVLISGPVSLFIQHKGQLMSAGKQVGYGGTSQVASANYISTVGLSSGQFNMPLPTDYIVSYSPVYWLKMDDKWFDFLNEKQFLKLFPEKSDKLKDFIKTNRIKTDKPADLVRLVRYCSIL